MCRLFTPISQEASYNIVQFPVVLKISLLNLHLCLRTTATEDEFIEYQISKLRIETVLKIKLAPASFPELKKNLICIVLSLN